MDDALASVKGTAFGLDTAAATAAGAVASGVKPGEDLTRTLKLMADAATIAGTDMGGMGSIFNKVAASGRLQGDVIAQLQDAGIPLLQLVAQQMGVTAAEAADMASKGRVSFDTFRDAMEAGFGGAALKSGNTTTGAFNNMLAALSRVGANFLSRVYPVFQQAFTGIIEVLAPLEADAKSLGVEFGNFIRDIAPAVIAVTTGVVGVFKALASWISQNAALVRVLATGVGVAVAWFLAWRAAMGITAFMQTTIGVTQLRIATIASTAALLANKAAHIGSRVALMATVTATGIATAAQWAWNTGMTANPIGVIIVAIGALAAGLMWFFTQTQLGKQIWENVSRFLVDSWNNLASVFDTVWIAIVDLWNTVWGAIGSFFEGIWAGIVSAAASYVRAVQATITSIITAIQTVWANTWSGITSFFERAWNQIISTIHTVGVVFGSVFGAIGGVVTGAFHGVMDTVRSVLNGIIDAVNTVIGAINTVAGVMGGAIGLQLSMDKIPRLADGGIIPAKRGGVLANIGEGRYDEAVIPLSPKVWGVSLCVDSFLIREDEHYVYETSIQCPVQV